MTRMRLVLVVALLLLLLLLVPTDPEWLEPPPPPHPPTPVALSVDAPFGGSSRSSSPSLDQGSEIAPSAAASSISGTGQSALTEAILSGTVLDHEGRLLSDYLIEDALQVFT